MSICYNLERKQSSYFQAKGNFGGETIPDSVFHLVPITTPSSSLIFGGLCRRILWFGFPFFFANFLPTSKKRGKGRFILVAVTIPSKQG
jgi:hypothetical protein